MALPARVDGLCSQESSMCAEQCATIIGPEASLLNSSDAVASALAEENLREPYVDPAFRSLAVYASLLKDPYD